MLGGTSQSVIFVLVSGGRPKAPVAEGGPIGYFPMGGTDGTGSPGCGGIGRPPETREITEKEMVKLG